MSTSRQLKTDDPRTDPKPAPRLDGVALAQVDEISRLWPNRFTRATLLEKSPHYLAEMAKLARADAAQGRADAVRDSARIEVEADAGVAARNARETALRNATNRHYASFGGK